MGEYSQANNVLRSGSHPVTLRACPSSQFRLRARVIVASAWRLARAIAIASLLYTQPTHAYEIRIDGMHCAASVHILAREAPLSELLRQLAKSLGFEVRYEASFDPDVSIDSTMSASEAIAKIGQSVNLSIVEDRNGGCANDRRVTKVVVLPTSGRTSAAQPSNEPRAMVFGTPEQMRKSQEEVDAFIEETHGGSRHGP